MSSSKQERKKIALYVSIPAEEVGKVIDIYDDSSVDVVIEIIREKFGYGKTAKLQLVLIIGDKHGYTIGKTHKFRDEEEIICEII